MAFLFHDFTISNFLILISLYVFYHIYMRAHLHVRISNFDEVEREHPLSPVDSGFVERGPLAELQTTFP